MNKKFISLILVPFWFIACQQPNEIIDKASVDAPFTWDNATVYFLMTDRFHNGDPSNDYQHVDDNPPASYRGYMGGDIKGITAKIEEGYFSDLGINALWMTPLVEQIQGSVDEGTGNSFGFHGYWTRDWTSMNPQAGTEEELKEMIASAHAKGIRVLIDVVANHTGPVTPLDSKWPDEWVKTGPRCVYKDAETTINCTLVDNLPDIKTESDQEVELPDFLIQKWKSEGRYDKEVGELDAWFIETGYPRTPVNYILKWLVDYVKKYGVDGFRVDTVKHTESYVWKNLWDAASKAFEKWKAENQEGKLEDDVPFYMVGEVYNYYISGGRDFDYGDQKVDFYKDGFKALINFDFKGDAHNDYESIFAKYDSLLHGAMKGYSVLNYISSHDDGGPFDVNRERPIEAGTKLLLCPGGVQIYYGDESARSLTVEAEGDATLRSYMNWDEVNTNMQRDGYTIQEVLSHWKKLGKFRNDHPSVGAGRHLKISDAPYTFSRSWTQDDFTDKVVIALDLETEEKTIDVGDNFANGEILTEAYSDQEVKVEEGKVRLSTPFDIVLLSK